MFKNVKHALVDYDSDEDENEDVTSKKMEDTERLSKRPATDSNSILSNYNLNEKTDTPNVPSEETLSNNDSNSNAFEAKNVLKHSPESEASSSIEMSLETNGTGEKKLKDLSDSTEFTEITVNSNDLNFATIKKDSTCIQKENSLKYDSGDFNIKLKRTVSIKLLNFEFITCVSTRNSTKSYVVA